MGNYNWELIDAFVSPAEFNRFCSWLDDLLVGGFATETPVLDSYAGPLFDEKWFRCNASSEVWRFVTPQGPFHGYWGPVKFKV